MMILRLLLSSIFLFGIQSSQAQSKKLIRTYGIKSVSTTIIDYNDGVESGSYLYFVESFDKDGEWIERSEYKRDGTLKSQEKRMYDRGVLVSELEEKGPEKAREEKPGSFKHSTFEYQKGNLIREKSWDKDGNLVSSKDFLYDRFGNKIRETEKDEQDQIKKTEEYAYDSKGLRISKVTLNRKGEMTEKQVYDYQ